MVGAAVHRDELDHHPCRRGVRPLLRRRLLVPAVRSGAGSGAGRRALRRDAGRTGAGAMIELVAVLGLAAGLIGVADTIPYVRDTLRGSTRPHRGTWLIWGVLAVVVSLSQYADGASWSPVMAGVQAVLTRLVFVLSIRRGEGGVSRADIAMVAIAGAGVIGWIAADEPLVATACVVAADLIGAGLM